MTWLSSMLWYCYDVRVGHHIHIIQCCNVSIIHSFITSLYLLIHISLLCLLQIPNKQQFCFRFNRQGTHKTLEKDLVVALLKMCLNNDRVTSHRLDTFCEFLETTKDESYSKITLDQWRSFLDFSQEFPDEGSLMGYDESESAWPVLIDEYVEFMEKKAKWELCLVSLWRGTRGEITCDDFSFQFCHTFVDCCLPSPLKVSNAYLHEKGSFLDCM